MDQISKDSKQDFIYTSFSKISAGTLLVIKDQDDKVITAFKTGRDIQNMIYSSEDLDYESYKIYTGGTIDGEETNGLYTKINNYTGGEEISYNNGNNDMRPNDNSTQNNASNIILIVLIIEVVLLTVLVLFYKRRSQE